MAATSPGGSPSWYWLWSINNAASRPSLASRSGANSGSAKIRALARQMVERQGGLLQLGQRPHHGGQTPAFRQGVHRRPLGPECVEVADGGLHLRELQVRAPSLVIG